MPYLLHSIKPIIIHHHHHHSHHFHHLHLHLFNDSLITAQKSSHVQPKQPSGSSISAALNIVNRETSYRVEMLMKRQGHRCIGHLKTTDSLQCDAARIYISND